jgi:hypothetical protein
MMAHHIDAPSHRFLSAVTAEHEARARLIDAKAAGKERGVISNLTHAWRRKVVALLAAYSAPDNWRGKQPLGALPQDLASILSNQTQRLAVAEANLQSALTLARAECDRDLGNGGSGRIGVCGALNAVLRYLQSNPSLEGQLFPVSLLATGLADLAKGNLVAPIFLPTKKRGRRSAPLHKASQKQIVAALVSVLMDDEKFQPDAGKREIAANVHVQRQIHKLGLKIAAPTVGNWRSEVTAHLRGVGVPGVKDHKRPEPGNTQTPLYLALWYDWRVRKASDPTVHAVRFVAGVLSGDNVKSLLAA